MDKQTFTNSCCSIDLESTPNGGFFAVAAAYKGNTFVRKTPFDINKVLTELDFFTKDTTYLLGHNILHHDRPLCRAISTNLNFLSKPTVDALYLSPFAFPIFSHNKNSSGEAPDYCQNWVIISLVWLADS